MKISFEVGVQQNYPVAQLIYRPDEESFDMVPVPRGCVYSVLISHYFEIESDDARHVIRVGGLCPYLSWKLTESAPPEGNRGALIVTFEKEPQPGVSYQLEGTDEWPVLVNPRLGWVCIGEPTFVRPVVAVEFLKGCIAVVENESLRAVWLHPESLPTEVTQQSEVGH